MSFFRRGLSSNFKIAFKYRGRRHLFFNAATASSTQLVGSSAVPHIVPSLIPYIMALLLASTNDNENCDGMDHIVTDPPLEVYAVS